MLDGKKRARQNVVDEFGHFQTKLGSNKTIPVVENGVEMPSNYSGTDEMRFNKDHIKEVFGEVLVIINKELKLY